MKTCRRENVVRSGMVAALLVWPLLLGVVSCAETGTDVSVLGSWEQPECSLGAFEWAPTFATWSRGPDDSGVLRIQDVAGPLDRNDHLVFAFRSTSTLRDSIGEPISIAPRDTEADGFGTLNFHSRCPKTVRRSTDLTGTVTFEEFTGALDSRVRGRAVLQASDARDPADVHAEDLEVDFTFRILRFPPYQPFNAGN